jgi:hypothetical protein
MIIDKTWQDAKALLDKYNGSLSLTQHCGGSWHGTLTVTLDAPNTGYARTLSFHSSGSDYPNEVTVWLMKDFHRWLSGMKSND